MEGHCNGQRRRQSRGWRPALLPAAGTSLCCAACTTRGSAIRPGSSRGPSPCCRGGGGGGGRGCGGGPAGGSSGSSYASLTAAWAPDGTVTSPGIGGCGCAGGGGGSSALAYESAVPASASASASAGAEQRHSQIQFHIFSLSVYCSQDSPGISMIVFFLPNSRGLLPTFHTNCPDGSHFAQMGSHFTQNTTTNPCSLLSSHKRLSGICTNTKHPQPHSKTPLSWPDFESGQNELLSGQNGPHLGKMFEKWAKRLRSGQKKNYSWNIKAKQEYQSRSFYKFKQNQSRLLILNHMLL